MNYKKLDLPMLPLELKFKIVSEMKKKYNKQLTTTHQFGDYGQIQDDLEKYGVVLKPEEARYHETTGSVGFYDLSDKHKVKLQHYFKKTPELCNRRWAAQVVAGQKEHTAPHIDPPKFRKEGMLYILKTGGPSVTTTWYKLKDQHQALGVDHSVGIPMQMIEEVESHILEENCWHYFNFSEIHGVTNQPDVRFALWAY
jgi:hypothetical protein